MKRTLIITGIIAVLIVAAAVYFLSGYFKDANRQAYDAVPIDAAFILEFPDVKKDNQKISATPIWEELQSYELINRLQLHLQIIDSFFLNAEEKELPLIASFHKIKSDDYGMLYVLPSDFLNEDLLIRTKNQHITGSSERIYKKTKIYEIKNIFSDVPIAVAEKDGLLLLSFEPFLLENAIATLESNIKKGKQFQKVYDLSRKSNDPKILINLNHLSSFISIFTNAEAEESLKSLSNFCNWIALDLSFAEKTIIVSGYAAGSPATMMATLGGDGTEVEVKKILPFNTAFFYYINTNKLEDLIFEKGKINQDFNKYFKDWIGSVATFAITEPFDTAISNDVLIMLQSVDNELALSQLKSLAALKMDVVNIEPETYKNYDIYKLDQIEDFEKLVGFKSSHIKNPYFTIIEDYVIFGNSLGNIKVLIERYLEQQTLSKDIDFLNFRKNMADHPQVNIYLNTSRILQILQRNASPSFSRYLDTAFNDFKKLNPIGIQFSHYQDNVFLVNGLIQSTKNFQKRTNLLWKTELKSTISMQPKIVINHNNNESEILVQDDENFLYLIGKNGDIIWSRQLDNKITGEIQQVDFYLNGKLQYLFSTRESINLIDRNGDFVENFPLRLPSYITSGLATFDYDRNNNYRMFLGCENGNVYGFEKSGKPLQGWNPRKNAGVILHPIQYLDFEGRDFLIAITDAGKLLFFNRRGDLRVPEIPLDAKFNQNFEIVADQSNPVNLFNVSNDGRFFSVQLNGNFQIDSLGEFYDPVIFKMADISGDDTKEFIVMDDLNLFAFDKNKNKLFEYSLPAGITNDLLIIKNKVVKDKIGLYAPEEGMLYLITENGSVAENFPIKGNAPFVITDLYKDGEKVLITGTKDKTITSYRLK